MAVLHDFLGHVLDDAVRLTVFGEVPQLVLVAEQAVALSGVQAADLISAEDGPRSDTGEHFSAR